MLKCVEEIETNNQDKSESTNKIIESVELLSDDFNKVVNELRDDGDNVMALVNENLNLIKVIQKKLNYIDIRK